MSLIPFARQSKDADYNGERLINYFLRPSETIASSVLIGASGFKPTFDLGSEVRAIIDEDGTPYAIAGGKLWDVSGAAAVELAGVVDSDQTFMATNGRQVGIVADKRYFHWDGTTLTEPDTGALTEPSGIAYIDGYFILIGTVSGRGDGWAFSNLDDGTTFDGLDFAFAENATDALVAVINDHGQLWFIGTRTIEVFYNSGNADQPFVRNAGALIEQGCLDGRTVAKEDNTVFWVAPENIVFRSGGGTPQVVSTREIEEELAASTVTGALTFIDRGHKFYGITRSGKTTLCYDMTTGLWCERSRGSANNPSSICCGTARGGFLGTVTGKVGKLDQATFTDDGEPMVAEAISPPVMQGGNPFSVGRMHINLSSGDYDIGRTPQIMLQTSRDGRVWGQERTRDLGRLGRFFTEVRWHALGNFKRFQVRLRISDEVQRDLMGASYE